jgi:zinc protease
MPTTAVVGANFGREVLGSAIPVLVEFCGGRSTTPALEAVANQLEGKVKIVRVDIGLNHALKWEYEIRALPALILFKQGRPVARRIGGLVRHEELEEWVDGALILALATRRTSAARCATQFKLSNGMEVVVIPDHRAPIVTHMVWYRAGAGDDPLGFSGVACLVEYLTFKSMDKIGDASRTIARLGGKQNAFCGKDATVYWQRVSKNSLETVMEVEAERMARLNITDDEVTIVRNVMLESLREGDNDPGAQLHEKMHAALYRSHPYGIPRVGWSNEIARLTRRDATRFFKRHYVPNNAVLIVSGDVAPEEVRRLAEGAYGKLPTGALSQRACSQAPPAIVDHRITITDPRAGAGRFSRQYAVPSYATAPPGDGEALELLTKILVVGTGSRLHRKLVIEKRLAAIVAGRYRRLGVQAGFISLSAVPNGVDLNVIEGVVDDVLEDVRQNGVTRVELGGAKRSLLASHILDGDDQQHLARSYGWAVVTGQTIDEFEDWAASISKVTVADVIKAANKYLDPRQAVTGYLLSGQGDGEAVRRLRRDKPAAIRRKAPSSPVRQKGY